MTRDWRVWPLHERPRDPPRVQGDRLTATGILTGTIAEVAPGGVNHLLNAARVALNIPRIYPTLILAMRRAIVKRRTPTRDQSRTMK
jgi:hypothetical protein